MITPEEFRKRWIPVAVDEVIVRYEPPMLDAIAMPPQSRDFLLAAGLPRSAAPFLGIDSPRVGPLPTAAQSWRLSEEFLGFRMIGSDGAGSPLCIEEGSGRIVILDHDDDFRVQLVNTSVPQFAESLLVYEEFVKGVIAAKGEDAWLDNDIPTRHRIRLGQELERIDAGAVMPGSFWGNERRRLLTS